MAAEINKYQTELASRQQNKRSRSILTEDSKEAPMLLSSSDTALSTQYPFNQSIHPTESDLQEMFDAPRTMQPTRRPLFRDYDYRVRSEGSTPYRSLQSSADSEDINKMEEDDEVPPDNPRWAIFYFVLYTIFSTYNLIAGKFFRTWYPEMSTFQLLFYRGFSACLVMGLYMGRDSKTQLFTNVTLDNLLPLTFRVFQGIFSQFIRYYAMSFFSLSMIGVIQKLAPVFTVVLAYMILSEKLSNLEILLNIIAIIASLLVTIGDHKQNGDSYTNNHYLALFFLVLNPVFIGMSAIALRKMKKTSTETLTTWTNIVQSTFMATCILCLGQTFLHFPSLFTGLDWLMLLGMTMSVIGAQTFKLLAFQNQAASKLQVLGNLQMVYQFLFDEFLFHTYFSEMQYWGIGVCVLTFILDIYLTMAGTSSTQPQVVAKHQQLPQTMTTTVRNLPSADLIKHDDETSLPLPLLTQSQRRANNNSDAENSLTAKKPENSSIGDTSSTKSSDQFNFNVGTSGETMEMPKQRRGIAASESSDSFQSDRQQYLRRRRATHISSKYKGKVYKEDINND